jgi:hypothetical protein
MAAVFKENEWVQCLCLKETGVWYDVHIWRITTKGYVLKFKEFRKGFSSFVPFDEGMPIYSDNICNV